MESKSSDKLSDLTTEVVRFRDERDWKQFHNIKDMALSLSLEIAELLELMQWKNDQILVQHLKRYHKEVGEELSDILYWVLLIAHDVDVNLAEAFSHKMKANELKYPVNRARGSSDKYSSLKKRSHR